jgi:hypothetical protein
VVYLIVYMIYSMIVSMISVLLEKFMFTKTMKNRAMFKMLFFAILESFGFRQLMSIFRMGAFFSRNRHKWGNMVRTQQVHRDEEQASAGN